MPEFRGIRITKAHQSARHAYRRTLAKAVRAASKGTKWRCSQGCLFQDHGGWFVAVQPRVYIYEPKTKASLSVKPMSIDPIFWDLMGSSSNQSRPLSFRLFGAWTCPAPQLVEMDVPEDDVVDLVAEHLRRIADEQLETLASWSFDDFLQLCRGARAASPDGYLPCVVTTLIAMGREEKALEACADAKHAGAFDGFLTPQGSFVEMASGWLQLSIAAKAQH
jgi:hypothetical protein